MDICGCLVEGDVITISIRTRKKNIFSSFFIIFPSFARSREEENCVFFGHSLDGSPRRFFFFVCRVFSHSVPSLLRLRTCLLLLLDVGRSLYVLDPSAEKKSSSGIMEEGELQVGANCRPIARTLSIIDRPPYMLCVRLGYFARKKTEHIES